MFFDRKQDVIDFELTQYGKHLLSMGKFKPVYYEFFDNDILYDTEYAGVEEEQNASKKRIVEETPRCRTQYAYHGVETDIVKSLTNIKEDGVEAPRMLGKIEKHYSLNGPLANSAPNIQYAPAWSIKFAHGELSGSVDVLTGTTHKTLFVPQLSSSVTFKTQVVANSFGYDSAEDDEFGSDLEINGVFGDKLNFGQDKVLRVEEDYLLLEIEEKNSIYSSKNFDIEIFEETKDGELIPLVFSTGPNAKDGGVSDVESEEELMETVPSLNKKYVGYFIDILVDNEIDDKILCEFDLLKKKKYLFDRYRICEPGKKGKKTIYDESFNPDYDGDAC